MRPERRCSENSGPLPTQTRALEAAAVPIPPPPPLLLPRLRGAVTCPWPHCGEATGGEEVAPGAALCLGVASRGRRVWGPQAGGAWPQGCELVTAATTVLPSLRPQPCPRLHSCSLSVPPGTLATGQFPTRPPPSGPCSCCLSPRALTASRSQAGAVPAPRFMLGPGRASSPGLSFPMAERVGKAPGLEHRA